ncbi:origin recognition complex subunit 5 [Erpetoichthys calabaricus]|uniref:Origin recognition complex subunit 5 n=1 Tax=Erpetoichthys calabaricus TaxID=27687 RepID=A0A8C4RJZ7_ERPCA|nr:origin recognition complex subunit 5 [Erpetoichthys calabaricus]XP_028664603.1 origin recognition complex subunit 5 [Erpetoichthys calabaricus]
MPDQTPFPTYMKDVLLRLKKQLPCRDNEVSMLLSLFGEPQHYSYPSILIYGHRATGKTFVTQTVLQELKLPHAFVSMVECFTPRLLFQQILSQLSSLYPSLDEEFHCETLNDFIRIFRQLSTSNVLDQQTVYIVIDQAEVLRDMDANLLPGFLRLQELVGGNITVIFLTEIVWEKFRPNTGCLEPILFYFPDYTKAELQQILCKDRHPEFSDDLYATYINILLGVFYAVCRDLCELRHLAALNFSKFCEPLLKGEVRESDTHKLWRSIEPHLRKAMQTVYLREVSSLQWEMMQDTKEETGYLKGLSAYTHVDLPYYSKFLLIAAYLASFNPARTDKRFFLKHHGKMKKVTFLKKHEKTSNHLLGPKPFPLDRLLAIFYSIVDSRVASTANIFSQISSLVTLQLLTLVGHSDQLDSPKYKCTVSMDFICAIARTVNFDIVRYLYDFL